MLLRLLTALTSGALLAALWAWLSLPSPKQNNATPLILQPERIRIVSGSATLKDGYLAVEAPGSAQTILSIPLSPLQSNRYRFLHFDLRDNAPSESQPQFFWRRAGQKKVETLAIGNAPLDLLDLGNQEQWRGVITEVGFLLPGKGNHQWKVGKIELLPSDKKTAALVLLNRWLELELWSQHSVHFLKGDRVEAGTSLQVIVTIWVLTSLLFYLLVSGKQQRYLAIPFILFLGWAVLDARWLWNLWRHALVTWNTFSSQYESNKYRSAIDKDIHELAQAILSELPPNKSEDIYLPVKYPPVMHYFYAKLPYFLAPHRVHMLTRDTRHGFVVVLKHTATLYDGSNKRLRLDERWLENAHVLLKSPEGTLYLFGNKKADGS